jgi:hypothetical protein
MNYTCLRFRIDLPSPLGLQQVRDDLFRLGITRFSVDFVTQSLEVFTEWIAPERIEDAMRRSGRQCKRLKTN